MAATLVDTLGTVSLDSAAGRKLLRRVASSREEWHFRADAADGWRVSFWRRVDGQPGDAAVTVTVETDATVTVSGRTGDDVKPLHDATAVAVPAAARVHGWGADCRAVAGLLARGWKLAIEHSAGSTTSSGYGLAFQRLELYRYDRRGYMESVGIGETVYVNGGRVIAGPVS